VKGQRAQRAQAVVGNDLALRMELASGIYLMRVGKGKELSGKDQDSA
jgi:hypothetical protein